MRIQAHPGLCLAGKAVLLPPPGAAHPAGTGAAHRASFAGLSPARLRWYRSVSMTPLRIPARFGVLGAGVVSAAPRAGWRRRRARRRTPHRQLAGAAAALVDGQWRHPLLRAHRHRQGDGAVVREPSVELHHALRRAPRAEQGNKPCHPERSAAPHFPGLHPSARSEGSAVRAEGPVGRAGLLPPRARFFGRHMGECGRWRWRMAPSE
jgi:hypothetical protein